MHLDEALDRYILQLRADGRSQHTVNQYRRHIGVLIAWLASKGLCGDVGAIGHEVLALFLTSDTALKRADGVPKRATTVNAMRSSLRTFFGYLNAAGEIDRNPARLIRRARTGTAPPRALSDADQERLLAVLAQAEGRSARRDHALFHLLLATGLRIGSALALRVEDLDLDAGEIEVRVTKGDRPGRVFAPPSLVEHLREYVAEVEKGFLFPGQAGAPLNRRQAARRLAEWVEKAGIRRGASPHTLRHSFATRLYRKTGDILLVQQAVGHRAIASTVVYARCEEQRVRDALGV